MTRLTLNFLGSFQVALDEEPVTTFKSNKVRALLAYLAVEADRPHQREYLAGLLWPDQPPRTALSNLRYTLSNLRRVIGDRTASPPFLSITRKTLQFNITSQAWLDVAAFGRARAEADRRGPGLMAVEPLEQAVRLYRGDFLEGFPGDKELLFEEWLLFTREQYARQLADILHCLIELHLSRGDYQAAHRYARRQLHMDPWQEETHRQVMRLLALSGQRGAALAQYESCRQILVTELGVEPTPETTALYERIREGAWPEPAQPATVVCGPGQKDRAVPFVARQRELASLDGFLETALAGQGRVAFVTGEAGSGKTVLLREFSRRAAARHGDLVVAGGSCNALTGPGEPYQPFREILQMLAGDIEAKRAGGEITRIQARRLWQIFPTAVRTIREVGPELIDLFVSEQHLARYVDHWPAAWSEPAGPAWEDRLAQDSGPLAVEPPRTGPADLFSQVGRVLYRLAHQQPLLLVLDDLQWADAGSAGLLFHLGRHLTGSRILIVGAYRPDQVIAGRPDDHRARHPLEPVVNELRRELGDIQIDLGQANRQEFVEALLDARPNRLGPAFRRTLARQPGGNALFTIELLRGLQEQGGLVQNRQGLWIEGESLDWDRLPGRVEAVIAERIGHLRPEWQTLLTIASVEGESFSAEVVAGVQGVAEATVIRLLSGPLSQQCDLVQSQQVVRLDGHRLSRYRFRHHLFQTYLYSRLDPVERSHLHEAVGLILEQLYAGSGAETGVTLQLAHHFEAAGLVLKAGEYFLRAGQWAIHLSAYEEAIALLTHGLGLLERLPESPERAELELALRLALNAPLFAIRGWGGAERAEVAERALQLCRQLGEAGPLMQTLFVQADLCRARGEHQASLDLGEQLLTLAYRSQESSQTMLAHMTLAETHFFHGRLAAARTHFEAVIACYDPDRRQSLVSLTGLELGLSSRAWLTWTLWILGYPAQALAYSREALALARDLDQPLTLSFVLAFAGCAFSLLRGEMETAGQELEALTQIVAEEAVTFMKAWSMIYQGWWRARQGQVAAGIDQMRAGLAAWQETGAVIVGATCWPLVDLYWQVGQVEAGLTLANETLAINDQTGERLCQAELYRLKGELLLKAESDGDRDEAEQCFLRAIEIARRQQARSWELRATMSLARLWQRQGQTAAARQRLADIYGWFSEGFDTPDLQEARSLQAELAADGQPG